MLLYCTLSRNGRANAMPMHDGNLNLNFLTSFRTILTNALKYLIGRNKNSSN